MRKPVKKKKTVRKTAVKKSPAVTSNAIPNGYTEQRVMQSLNYAYNTPDEIVSLISRYGVSITNADHTSLEEYIHMVKSSADRVLFLLKDLRELP